MLAELYILKGKDAGKFFKLGNDPFVFLGRSITNQVPLDDREVSRVHARLEFSTQGCTLQDLSSGNGTYVNEEKTSKRVIKDGDLIRIGKSIMVVLLESDVEAQDWSDFVGDPNVREDSESSGELVLTESVEETAVPTSGQPTVPKDSQPPTVIVQAVGAKKPAPVAEPEAAPFSSEEEREIEAGGARGKKQRVSLRNLIPGYTIERKMGGSRSSSQAVIYKAFQKALERTVAIKTLLARGEDRDKQARKFMLEVSQVARLPHPNVVVIHDAGRVKNFYYFVMEYLAGGSMLDVIEDKRPLVLNSALRMAYEIANALAYIHNHGIMHRGVNPGCILVDTATSMSKLCGFGFAKDMEMSTGDTTYLTAPLEGFSFLAPEQILGKECTNRVDIYSLGITLWSVLTGQMPVEGKSHIAVSSKILEGDIPNIADVMPDIPSDVVNIIENCIAVDPDDRYENAEIVARALRRAWKKIETTSGRLPLTS